MPAATKDCTIVDLLKNVARLPFDMFGVKSLEEVEADAQARKTATEVGRAMLANALGDSGLGGKIADLINKLGIRLTDTNTTHLLNYYNDKRNLGSSYGAAADGTIRHIIDRANQDGVLSIKEIQHEGVPGQGKVVSQVVTDPDLVADAKRVASILPDSHIMDDGQLHLSDLMQYANEFRLGTPERYKALEAMSMPLQVQREMEKAFGIESPENPNGFPVHREHIQSHVMTEQGRLVESNTGPVVAQRFGSKQGFQRGDDVASMSEGFLAGNKYLPYSEAQSSRIAQGWHAMADEYLNRALDGVGKTATDLLPTLLVDDLNLAKQITSQYAYLNKVLTRASKDGIGTNSWLPSNVTAAFPGINNMVQDAKIASQEGDLTARKAAYATLQAQAEAQMNQASGFLQDFSDKRAKTIKSIQSGTNPAVRGAYPTEFNGKYYPYDQGHELQGVKDSEVPTGIMGVVNNINDAVRPVMATLDVSFMGVQGLMAALAHPANYFSALGTLFSNGYGDYEAKLKASGQLDSMIRDGVHWTAKNDASDFLFPSTIKRIPVVGTMANWSDEAFSRFGNILRSELYNAGFNPATMVGDALEAEKARRGLARSVNLTTGFTPNNPSSIERTLEFAPRYFRANLGLLADALTKHDLSAMGASRTIGTAITSGVALTYALNSVSGQETDFDPTSPNFLRVRFGGQDWSIFGTWDTLARAVTKSATDGPLAGAEYLARVKASPIITKVFDALQGQTLGGDSLNWSSPTDVLLSAAKMAKTVAPISVEQNAESVAGNPSMLTDPQSVAGLGLQFLGTKGSPLSGSEKLAIQRDELAQAAYKQPWSQLEPNQKQTLIEKNGIQSESTSQIGKSFAYHSAITDRYNQLQQHIDATLPAGPDWRTAYNNLNKERLGAFTQWAEQNPEALAQIRQTKPANSNEAARQGLYQIFDQADKERWTPTEVSTAVGQFQDGLTQEQSDYISRNTGLKDTPMVKEYKSAEKVLRPYWDLADKVWERLNPNLPQEVQADSLQAYQDGLITRLRAAGLPDSIIMTRIQQNPVIQEITKATGELRNRYRAGHPEVDRELVKWYGYRATSSLGTAAPAA